MRTFLHDNGARLTPDPNIYNRTNKKATCIASRFFIMVTRTGIEPMLPP